MTSRNQLSRKPCRWCVRIRQCAEELLDMRFGGPGQSAAWPGHRADTVEEGPQLGSDLPGAVVDQAVKPVGQDAACAEIPQLVPGFGTTTAATVVARDAGAVDAERPPVGCPPGGHALCAVAGAQAVGFQCPGVAGGAQIPFRPGSADPANGPETSTATCAILFAGDLTVRLGHGSGRRRARVGLRALRLTTPSSMAVLRAAAFSALVAINSADLPFHRLLLSGIAQRRAQCVTEGPPQRRGPEVRGGSQPLRP